MKKLITTLAFVAVAAAASFGQSENETIVKARNAAKACFQAAGVSNGQIQSTAALEPCGNGNYSGTITFYVIGECPFPTDCLPLPTTIATVTVDCNDNYSVVCN